MAGNARSPRALLGVFAIVLVAGVAAPASASAFECGPVLDDFNRADSTDLGADWVEPNAPSLAISSNRLTNPTTQYGFATHTTATGNSACADIAADPAIGSQYAGIGLRTSNPGSVLWVKVQDNNGGGGEFNEIFFRIGHQGVSPNGTFSPQVTVPSFTSGQMHVRAVGDTFTVEINTDGDPESEIDITREIVPSTGFTAPNGTGVSLGAYNGSALDNFSVLADADWDGALDIADNCPTGANPGQQNLDGDSLGDVCDLDDDGDTVADGADKCPAAKPATDANGDGCTDPGAKLTGSGVFRGLGKGAKGKRAKKRYFFTFQDDLPGASFRCSLDGAAFAPCSSPAVYTGLRPGKHTFSVKSVDANGESAPQSTSFRIRKPRRR